jgi:hypothetical protein
MTGTASGAIRLQTAAYRHNFGLQVRLHVREVARQAVGAKAHHYYGAVRPCIPNAMRAVQALAIAPKGFTAAQFTDKVHSLTSLTEADYTTRQAAYDLRKLRAKALITKPGRSRCYVVPPAGARTSLLFSPCATRSSPPSSPACAAHASDIRLRS